MFQPICRVLCVEDDVDTCELITMWLKMESDLYEVTSVHHPKDAIKLVKRDKFDIYVIDSWLPEMSGIDLCKHIRETDPTTAIVFFSGAVQKVEEERARAAGANEYLIKPIESEKFVSTIVRLSECVGV